jgi:glycosyltransferase involved in cell wall biosynthesis
VSVGATADFSKDGQRTEGTLPYREYSVLASAVNHPDALNPYRALFNHRMLASLDDEGVALDVVSPRPFAPPAGPYSEYGNIPQTEEWDTYTVHHPRFFYLLPKRCFYGLTGDSFQKRVRRYIEREFAVPEVIHACHIYLDGYGLLEYANDHDLPLFVVAHGAILNSFEERSQGIRERVSATLEGAAGVLCVSDALAEKANAIVPDSKVHTVPIGANPDRYPVDRRGELRRELGFSEDQTVALFIGQLTERKGIPELTEVLPDLDAENTDFVFIGHGGDMEWEIRQALWRSGFSDVHLYTGITSLALRRWLALADLLVLPSRAEGRPTVIYEAMASETAVLASRAGGIPEQVVDGETGVLLPPNEPAALRAHLQELTANPRRLREMGRSGRTRLVDQGWTWDRYARRVRRLHMGALG